jgi:IS5 family transposase
LAGSKLSRRSAASELSDLLDSREIGALCAELEGLRWTGRRGYGPRTLVGACLVKSLYAIPTWTRVAALIREHLALADAVGGTPSEWACYRFAKKLREHKPLLDACLDRVVSSLRAEHPDLGTNIAIDGSDLPAYANGQRFLSKNGPEREHYSDPDASWGHRSAVSTRKGGGFYGYKLHAAVCTRTGLPLAWQIETARRNDGPIAEPLLDALIARGFSPVSCAMDKGYDAAPFYDAFEKRRCLPIIPLKQPLNKDTKPFVNDTPRCEHGFWTFAGADFKRHAAKWRCPTGECKPKSRWVKGSRRNPLIPRESRRWRDLYRNRVAVEREFGRLKNEYGLAPLRVRGLERVALHADLVMLARLSVALARARAVPLAA